MGAVRYEGLQHLVAYDEDYLEAEVREYITPKEFVTLFTLKPYSMKY